MSQVENPNDMRGPVNTFITIYYERYNQSTSSILALSWKVHKQRYGIKELNSNESLDGPISRIVRMANRRSKRESSKIFQSIVKEKPSIKSFELYKN